MNREIEFRGIVDFTGKWVFGSLHKNEDGDLFILTDHGDFRVKPETVGQFTTHKDCKGNKIYEGDILGLPETDADGVQFKNRFVRVVEWVNDGFFLIDNVERCGEVRKYGDRLALEIALNSNYAGIASCLKKYGDYAVIGNIHDIEKTIEKFK